MNVYISCCNNRQQQKCMCAACSFNYMYIPFCLIYAYCAPVILTPQFNIHCCCFPFFSKGKRTHFNIIEIIWLKTWIVCYLNEAVARKTLCKKTRAEKMCRKHTKWIHFKSRKIEKVPYYDFRELSVLKDATRRSVVYLAFSLCHAHNSFS